MTASDQLEASLETKCRREAFARGFYLVKWPAQSLIGAPDDILIGPGAPFGKSVLIEFKRPSGGRVRIAQKIMHAELAAKGFTVHLVRSWPQFVRILAEMSGQTQYIPDAA